MALRSARSSDEAVKRAPESYPERSGMKDALERAWHGRRVKPNEHDAPPVSTFPGPKEKRLPGQLSLTERP